MASVADFVSDVSPREREELDKVLCPGENVRWATRPLTQRGVEEWVDYIFMEAFALPWLGMTLYIAWRMLTSPCAGYNETLGFFLSSCLAVLVLLLFFAMGLFIALTPLRRLRRRQRTLYVLTNHRALVSEPTYWSWSVEAYPLHEHMLRRCVSRSHGRGDIIFKSERFRLNPQELPEYGFVFLPNLEEATHALEAALADLSPEK